MFRVVLIPIEFNEDDDLILSCACGLGSLGVRHVTLAHVVDTAGMESLVVPRAVDEALERLRTKARLLEAAGLSVEARISTGDPVCELSAMAVESHVDLVMCGSHAKSLLTETLEGSVSARLLRDATVPYLSVRYDLLRATDEPAKLLQHFGDKAILATDFSLSAARAFICALDLSGNVLKHVVVLHALEPGRSPRMEEIKEGAEFHLRSLQALCSEAGLSSSVCIRTEAPVHAVLDEINHREATAVIVGTHGRSAVQEVLLGSVSMTLLRQASCPVLIVP